MDDEVRASVPADIGRPDTVLFGLTVRQTAMLAATGLLLWSGYRLLGGFVPAPVLLVAAVPVAAVAVVVAVGRRDGIGLDAWLLAALRMATGPRDYTPVQVGHDLPAWAPAAEVARLAPLRLPAQAISDEGLIDLGGAGAAAVAAVTTINVELRTGAEQYALVEAMGRWCNSLTGPVQITVSSRPVDVAAYTQPMLKFRDLLPHPGLAEAAAGHLAFLDELAQRQDPLQRQVLITCRAPDAVAARRAATHTARALVGLGAATAILAGGAVTDALFAACHPWQAATAGRSAPGAAVAGALR